MKKRKNQSISKENKEKTTALNKENKTAFQLFLEWFTWTKIGVILTGMGVLASIIIYILSTPVSLSKKEILVKDISQNINYIKTNVHPERFTELQTMHPDAKLICDYQTNLLKFVYDWETYEKLPLLKDFNNENSVEFLKLILENQTIRNDYYEDLKQILIDWDKIVDYGNENSIPHYVPQKAVMKQLIDSYQVYYQQSKEKNNIIAQAATSMLAKNNEGGSLTAKDIEEIGKPIDQLKEDVDNYQFILDILTYFIEMNEKYELQLNTYKLKLQNDNNVVEIPSL